MNRAPAFSWPDDGAQLFEQAAAGMIDQFEAALSSQDQGRPGQRIRNSESLSVLLNTDGAIGGIASSLIGPAAWPVRAILFDKSLASNWALGWHQDRTICVRGHLETPGFGPWSVKDGLHHVEPPFDLIERMVTMRIHLDEVTGDNAPLRVSLGSHRIGRVPIADIENEVRRRSKLDCLARRGDVWAYATAILHASVRSTAPSRRRVLQVDYSADKLPEGLDWTGLA